MKARDLAVPLIVAAGAIGITLWARGIRGPVGNAGVPEPAKPVDAERYLGLWYEIARYENGFERDCDGVTAEYRRRDDGLVDVINRARRRGRNEHRRTARGRARVVPGSGGAKLKVSFFGPLFFGDYWVLDHADDYAWSIVGEPSGRFLWLLAREAHPTQAVLDTLDRRVGELGYDKALLRSTAQ